MIGCVALFVSFCWLSNFHLFSFLMCMHFVASDEREERDWRRDDRRGDDRRGDDRRGGDRCAGLPYLACRMTVLAVST